MAAVRTMLLGLAACGRVAFDARSDGAGDGPASNSGQNATGDTEISTTPALRPELAGAQRIERSGSGGCALVAGTVSCWGSTLLAGNGDDSDTRPRPIEATCE